VALPCNQSVDLSCWSKLSTDCSKRSAHSVERFDKHPFLAWIVKSGVFCGGHHNSLAYDLSFVGLVRSIFISSIQTTFFSSFHFVADFCFARCLMKALCLGVSLGFYILC
jgi:hypothetical protein